MVALYASHLADIGHEVIIETNIVNTVFPLSPKITIEAIPIKSVGGTVLWTFCHKRSDDILIADIIPLSVFLYARHGKRVAYYAQDHNSTHYAGWLMRSLVKVLNFIGLTLFQIKTIAVSENIARSLEKEYNAREITVVENGVNNEVFYPAPSEDLKAEKEGRSAILVLSRSDQRKGFDLACQVVEQLGATESVPFEVWTVGEAADRSFPRVRHRHFGYVNEETMRSLFSSADLFLYPSRSEGYPLMVVEAFACRCPVVTTEAVPYAIHGENAMVSKIGDIDSMVAHVSQVMRSPEVATSIAAHGYTYAQQHTLAAAKAAFENTLASIHRAAKTGL